MAVALDIQDLYHNHRNDLERRRRGLIQNLEMQYSIYITKLCQQKSEILRALNAKFDQELYELQETCTRIESIGKYDDCIPPEIPSIAFNDSEEDTVSELSQSDSPQEAHVEVSNPSKQETVTNNNNDHLHSRKRLKCAVSTNSNSMESTRSLISCKDTNNNDRTKMLVALQMAHDHDKKQMSKSADHHQNGKINGGFINRIHRNRKRLSQQRNTASNYKGYHLSKMERCHRIDMNMNPTNSNSKAPDPKRRKMNIDGHSSTLSFCSSDDGSIAFECEECGKSFLSPKDIKRHKMWHKTVRIIKPFVESQSQDDGDDDDDA